MGIYKRIGLGLPIIGILALSGYSAESLGQFLFILTGWIMFFGLCYIIGFLVEVMSEMREARSK